VKVLNKSQTHTHPPAPFSPPVGGKKGVNRSPLVPPTGGERGFRGEYMKSRKRVR